MLTVEGNAVINLEKVSCVRAIKTVPVVLHNAVGEVSKIGNL